MPVIWLVLNLHLPRLILQHCHHRSLLLTREKLREELNPLSHVGAKVYRVPLEEHGDDDSAGAWHDIHLARTVGFACGCQPLVQVVRRVELDGRAALGPADQRKVDASVTGGDNLQRQ